jgi:5-methyltetrahydropteroyltriglutamate--homocysteine methyltransferase
MLKTLLPTSLVGSLPQPDWLVDRALLGSNTPPRVRMRDLWRVAPDWLEQAQDDATLLAIRDQERAGLDILTDGEMRRESYSNRFATALEGVDLDNPGTVISRSGANVLVPRVTGKIRRKHAVEVRDLQFLRAHTDRTIKITVPGPFTMSQQAKNDYYPTAEAMALDYAVAVNEEIRDLFAAGADIVQVDEPYMQAKPDEARQYGVKALNRALEGITGTTAVHLCFGYGHMVKGKPAGYSFLTELAETPAKQVSIETAQPSLDCSVLEKLRGKTIILGVLDLGKHEVETAGTVAERIRRALPYVAADHLVIAPDCGMKYLSRESALGKMRAMVEGARLVRAELN